MRGDVPTPDGIQSIQFCSSAYDSYLYKREFDAAYTAADTSRIKHVRFFEPRRLPTIAVSALFSLDRIQVGDDVARVALNIYPFENGVMVIFSFLRSHAQHIQPFIEPFEAACGDALLQMISMRVLNSCENFVLAPNFWNALSNMQREAIGEFYSSSVFKDNNDAQHPTFMLFSAAQP